MRAVDQRGLTLNTDHGEAKAPNLLEINVFGKSADLLSKSHSLVTSGGSGRSATTSGTSISLAGVSFTMCAWIQTSGKLAACAQRYC
jgi:hypothetical protein